MIDIKLNRGLYSEEEYDDLERLMSTYSLCQSKRSGKTFLIATKCKKNTWWYCVYAFIIPFCIGFIMLIPINKWICLLLGIFAIFMLNGKDEGLYSFKPSKMKSSNGKKLIWFFTSVTILIYTAVCLLESLQFFEF